jgi:hypothetical protein
VLTPALDQRVGSYLRAATCSATSLLDTLRVEVAVSELDMGTVRPEERLASRCSGFPINSSRGA